MGQFHVLLQATNDISSFSLLTTSSLRKGRETEQWRKVLILGIEIEKEIEHRKSPVQIDSYIIP